MQTRHHNEPPQHERISLDTAAIPFWQRFACTMPQAKTVSGLGHTMLYELIGTGALKSVKVGRRRLIIVSSLRRLLLGDADSNSEVA